MCVLKFGVYIVVGILGCVKDLIMCDCLYLDECYIFILDEVDEMFKMGFVDDVIWIME